MRRKVTDLEVELTQIRAYAYDLSAKLEVATKRLETIACGLHYTGEGNDSWGQALRLQNTAAVGLQKISRMQQRPLP